MDRLIAGWRRRAAILLVTAAVLVGGATRVLAESWKLYRICTPTDACPLVRVDKGAATLSISEHPSRVECVFAGAEMVREKGWRIQCQGAQRYDLYRVVLQKRNDRIETREKVFVASHETESECNAAAGGIAALPLAELKNLAESKNAVSYLGCFPVGEVVETLAD